WQALDRRDGYQLSASKRFLPLGQQLLDHPRVLHPSQPLVQSLVLVAEALVVETQKVQDRGMEVADVHRVLDDVVREIVGFTVNGARPGAAAGQPHSKAARMMVAAVVLLG